MNALLEEQGEVQGALEALDAMDPAALDARIEAAMDALRLPPGDRDIASLSGGERRRVSLCKELLAHPDVLILDEPTNHLDADTVAWLETFLAGYSGTYALVTHDRYFLDRVANRMLEVFHGEIRSYEGNYSNFLEAKRSPAGDPGSNGREPAEGGRARTGVDQVDPGRATDEIEGPDRRIRRSRREGDPNSAGRRARLADSLRSPTRKQGCFDARRFQGLRRQGAARRLRVSTCRRGRSSGCDRCQRTRQDDPRQHDRRSRVSRTPARSRSVRRRTSATSTRRAKPCGTS